MNIKKLPYWLKGGLISMAFCLIFIVLALTIDFKSESLFEWLLIMALYPYGFVAMLLFGSGGISTLMMIGFLQQSLLYFAIGSFLGFIYGKIKTYFT